ncbi:ZYRO0D14872p [Zygosaccharomyces rouxii]|uniref:ZYRO0D14872p n=1 Tax=Zygosaccharomyces rouxii (strain ATCC 2623 / CBS 732 / NBRC 1130 / NCYC 568 / NRRL Y-229) TaxID=559307 RepID=C5DWH4_ZYGRC|nr:uncharacterized protein ZYRO0D14872g [Zygosaccharomyces rouxii]KAH9201054.1 hypothetical protein LQ764DRAFT_224526 [Zygosaccharomyces rouxii]CAR28143.1 ZYRO0D14872p [Zygosaccharomyces rouxii]
MTLCNEHHRYHTGILDYLTSKLLSIVDSNVGSSDGSSVIVGQVPATNQIMIEGMDIDESVDNVLTVAFLIFLTVMIAFLGAGLIALVLVMLMHSNPHQQDDEEKQVRQREYEEGDDDDEDDDDEMEL